jgi:hypothetical protein
VLPNEPAGQALLELLGSKRALEGKLGAEVVHVSYPDGQFCPSSLAAAAAAGYRYGYTTCGHRAADRPLLTIGRRTFWERTTAGLRGGFSPAVAACQVAGVFEALRPCRSDHGPRPPAAPPALARRHARAGGGAP